MLFWHLFLIALFHKSSGEDDICESNTYTWPMPAALAFTKELSDSEFAVTGSFMSLHCCATYFHTIEWFKDGAPYPWPGSTSSFIIDPASHNQTVYTQRVGHGDTGSYHCLVRNATHQIRHDVRLTVSGTFSSVGPPKATYAPRDIFRRTGEMARFYCEAYVGNIKLPDAKNEISWMRYGNNITIDLGPRFKQMAIHREDKRVLGSLLLIMNIQKEDFGQYWCAVSNTDDQLLEMTASLYQYDDDVPSLEMTLRLCLVLVMTLITVAVIAITFIRFRLQIKMMWKRLWHRCHSSEEKDVDVVVMYHERDEIVALEQIVLTLRHKYHYTCSTRQYLPLSQMITEEMSGRRLLVLLTPSMTNDLWSPANIAQVIFLLLSLHPKVICLFLKELPPTDFKTEEGRRLKDALSRVHYITHSETQDKNFWTIVQLGLPLQKRTKEIHGRESLENLM